MTEAKLAFNEQRMSSHISELSWSSYRLSDVDHYDRNSLAASPSANFRAEDKILQDLSNVGYG